MIVSVEKLEQIAKNLSTVAAVNLLDYKIERLIKIAPRSNIGLEESLRYILVNNLALCSRMTIFRLGVLNARDKGTASIVGL